MELRGWWSLGEVEVLHCGLHGVQRACWVFRHFGDVELGESGPFVGTVAERVGGVSCFVYFGFPNRYPLDFIRLTRLPFKCSSFHTF